MIDGQKSLFPNCLRSTGNLATLLHLATPRIIVLYIFIHTLSLSRCYKYTTQSDELINWYDRDFSTIPPLSLYKCHVYDTSRKLKMLWSTSYPTPLTKAFYPSRENTIFPIQIIQVHNKCFNIIIICFVAYLPVLVIIISVPSSLNLSQRSLVSK